MTDRKSVILTNHGNEWEIPRGNMSFLYLHAHSYRMRLPTLSLPNVLIHVHTLLCIFNIYTLIYIFQCVEKFHLHLNLPIVNSSISNLNYHFDIFEKNFDIFIEKTPVERKEIRNGSNGNCFEMQCNIFIIST